MQHTRIHEHKAKKRTKREKLDIGRIRIPWSMFHGPSSMGYSETKEEQKRLKLKICFFLRFLFFTLLTSHSFNIIQIL